MVLRLLRIPKVIFWNIEACLQKLGVNSDYLPPHEEWNRSIVPVPYIKKNLLEINIFRYSENI